jgi:hypothetical protein
VFSSLNNPYAALPAAYQTIAGSGAYANGPIMTVNISGLTVGQTYEIQFWVNDSRGAVGPYRSEVLNSGGNQVALAFNTGGADGGLGQFVLGTFVASAATQSFTITGSGSNGQTAAAQINALSVVVPSPPGTVPALTAPAMLLAGILLACCALWMLRRQHDVSAAA